MKITLKALAVILFAVAVSGCTSPKEEPFESKVVYKSDNLVITQISKNSYEHTSFLQTNDFGKVPCNGLIVSDNNEAIIFDTPSDDTGSEELIKWITDELHYKINAIIPTHFHNDCLGGLKAFEQKGVPSYAYHKTTALAKENNYVVPQNSFNDSITLKVGNQDVVVKFFGEGHTKDNVIGYFPSEDIMFGGCLIKEINAGKGYLGDSNVEAWSATVEKIKKEYPNVKIVIPGHGNYGDIQLLDFTINLFKPE